MEPYIRMNTEFRKQAKSDFETDFYKLMNNSVFGKTMVNLRNCVDVKIVRDWETDTVFGNDMAASAEQARIHRHDDLREQQDLDVRILLQLLESQIRSQMRAGLHRHRQPDLGHPDRRCVQRHARTLMDV